MTPEQHAHNMAKLRYHEQQAEKYRKLTRQYAYQLEAERIEVRKQDSEKFHRENKNT